MKLLRKDSLEWFNKLSLEEQFYKTIKHNKLIQGDRTRHPSTLTGHEIEIIFNAEFTINGIYKNEIK